MSSMELTTVLEDTRIMVFQKIPNTQQNELPKDQGSSSSENQLFIFTNRLRGSI